MSPDVPPDARSRRALRALGVAAAAVLAVVLAVLLPGDGGDPGPAAGTAAPSAAPTTPAPGTTGAAPTADPEPTAAPGPTDQPAAGDDPGAGSTVPVVVDELPPSLPPADLDEPAAVGDGMSGSIESVEAIEGTGTGPGNIAGPALRITVRLENGTAGPVPLDGVAVSLTHGADQVPASPLEDPSQAPFAGSLAVGESAEGVYVFTVPAETRDVVTVSVGYRAGAPFLVFTGRAS